MQDRRTDRAFTVEISEILNGRQAVSYDLLVRIADGLGVPRGRTGLCHFDGTLPLSVTDPPLPARHPETGDSVVRAPIVVGSYDAAMSVLESVSTAPATVASTGAMKMAPDQAEWVCWETSRELLLTVG